MHVFTKIITSVGLFVFIGCGGGGGASDSSLDKDNSSSEIYENTTLPKIKDTTIPEVLLEKNRVNSSKVNIFSKNENSKSNGFIQLRERVGDFYFRQMNMNINLSYVDSVWTQIESYCKDDEICNIPKDKIAFTYTQQLYNHDIKLISIYEQKSGDTISFRDTKETLKDKIGEKTMLGETTLITLEDSQFNYELKVDISNATIDNDNLTTIVRWNDSKSLYQIREELLNGYNGDKGICTDRKNSLIYSGFDYNNSLDLVNSTFEYGYDANCISTSSSFEGEVKNEYIQKHNRLFNLLELPNKIKITEHISDKIVSNEYHTPLDYYLEGEVKENGGFVIASDTEGFYNHELFDIDGNIISEISCIGDASHDLEDCTVAGVELIKSIVVKNFYKVGWFDNSPINVVEEHSAVFFNEDNTLNAFINCSTFKADYHLDNSGIVFSNIKEENNSSLVCLDDSYEKNFRSFLKKGYEFNSEGFVVWNGLSAELDVVDNKSKFDKDTFLSALTKNRYVDSYTMNNLFKVHSLGIREVFNPSENRTYFLSKQPNMKIENDKIYFDLIDATFEADIQVVDNDRIKFKNINKIDKENIVYPHRDCTNEPGENECLDGDESLQYEDNGFANVIEKFLNSSVSVSNSGNPSNGTLWFHNETLSFEGNY